MNSHKHFLLRKSFGHTQKPMYAPETDEEQTFRFYLFFNKFAVTGIDQTILVSRGKKNGSI